MFKKENFLFFAVIGLGFIYGILALLVFLTRGRIGPIVKKKLTVGLLIIMFNSFIGSGVVFGQTITPTPPPVPPYGIPPRTPTPVPPYGIPPRTPTPIPPYGIPVNDIGFNPSNSVVRLNSDFSVGVNFTINNSVLAAYGVDISYNDNLINAVGVREGAEGFMSAANYSNPGNISVSGFDINGIGPVRSIEFFIIDFVARAAGTTSLDGDVNNFTDSSYLDLDAYIIPGSVTVKDLLPGDVDDSGSVDIVDALKIARYSVGNVPAGFVEEAADVNRDGNINIVDALMVAQKYVGVIDEFPEG